MKLARLLLNYAYFLLGLWIMTFGIYLNILARSLGVSPWDVFHLGLLRHLPGISYGLITQIVGVVVILAAMLLGTRPRLGTILNMYLVGLFANWLIDNHTVPVPANWAWAALYLAVGIIIQGVGTGMYISANLGAGPRDSLMLGLNRTTGYGIALVRTIMEIGAVVVGIAMGGPFGAGTVVFSLTIGPCVELSLHAIKRVKQSKAYSKFAGAVLGTSSGQDVLDKEDDEGNGAARCSQK